MTSDWPHSQIDIVEGCNGADAPMQRSTLPWIGVQFSCTGTYIRVYKRPDAQTYVARCPNCGKSVRFRVGQGGTSCRQFVVHC